MFKLTVKHFIVIFFVFVYNSVSGQDALKSEIFQNIFPSSPTAASLGKYGEIPVGFYNGIPDISIPIHNLNIGSLSLPISINYHAGGVKIEEVASPVGLGWALNAGGAIIRQVRGLPDEVAGGYLSSIPRIQNYLYGNISPTELANFKNDIASGLADSEADIYFFNFGGVSGKFFYAENGSIVTIPNSTIRIEAGGNGWLITDNNGVEYSFDQSETSQTIAVSGQLSAQNFIPVTSWFLSRIKKPGTNFQITLEYENYSSSFLTLAPQTKYILNTGNTSCNVNPTQGIGSLLQNYVNGKRLKKIITAHETLDFVYSNLLRLDQETDKALEKIQIRNSNNSLIKDFVLTQTSLSQQAPGQQPGYTMYEQRMFLLSLEVKTNSRPDVEKYHFEYNAGGLPSRISGNQDMWGYANGYFNGYNLVPTMSFYSRLGHLITVPGANRSINSSAAQSGILNKIKYPTGGYTTFEYDGNIVSSYNFYSTLPKQGYVSVGSQINGGSIFQSETFAIVAPQNAPQYYQAECQVNFNNGGCGGGNASLECPMLSLVGVDNVYNIPINGNGPVSLPVGTYKLVLDLSFLDPESWLFQNAYGEIFFTKPPDPIIDEYGQAQYQIPMGGLRIKTISSFSSDNLLAGIRKYNYTLPGSDVSSGSVSQLPEYRTDVSYLVSSSAIGQTIIYNCDYIGLSSTSNYPLLNTKGGVVGYSYVRESIGQDGQGGSTEYYYTSPQSNPDLLNASFPFPPASEYDWRRGLLTKEIKSKFAGTVSGVPQFQKVSEKQIQYTSVDQLYNASIKTGQRVFNLTGSATYEQPGTYLELLGYPVVSGIILPSEEKLITYNDGNIPIQEIKSYDYNSQNYQPKWIRTLNSKGETMRQEFKYPFEVTNSLPTQTLIAENRVNELVETKVVNETLGKQISVVSKEFQNAQYGTEQLADIFKVKSAQGDALLQDEVTIISRDNNRNVVEVLGKDGIRVFIIYGYNYSLPIAKIVNATRSQVESLVNIASLQSLDEASLRSTLAVLRSIPNSQTSILTYKIGLGLSSETDIRGRTTYYEYDSLGRLYRVKDNEGNILKRFCYTVSGDQTSCN